jgi:hypothetical protein
MSMSPSYLAVSTALCTSSRWLPMVVSARVTTKPVPSLELVTVIPSAPHDIKFINGKANVEGWNPSDADPNAGSGKIGSCCSEMDIWEANSISTAYTPHPCKGTGLQECTDDVSCGDGDNRYSGLCDKDGCDFNVSAQRA